MQLVIIWLFVLIGAMGFMLFQAHVKNKQLENHMNDLIQLREAALDITNRVVNSDDETDLLQYILEKCMTLIPKSKFGSILMFDSEGFLTAKAQVGFIEEEITQFKLPLDESFLYIASKGKCDKTLIINRLEEIVLEDNIVKSEGQEWLIRSEVSAPLYIDNELVGLLCIDGDKSDLFTSKDIHVLDYMAKQISEVIVKHKLYEEILFLSRYDKQTGMLNRNCFDTEVIKRIKKSVSSGEELALVILDLDDLKWVNDTFGHDSGDNLITTFTVGLKTCLETSDLGSRYGGDEFVCLISGKSAEEITLILNGLQEELKMNPIRSGMAKIIPEFSYGVAEVNEVGHNFEELYKFADQRMYTQKRKKKAMKTSRVVRKYV